GIETGTEEEMICSQWNHLDLAGCGLDIQLPQQRQATVPGPLAVGYQDRGRRQQRLRGATLEHRLMHLVLENEDVPTMKQDSEGSPQPLLGPFRGIGRRLDVPTPDEL